MNKEYYNRYDQCWFVIGRLYACEYTEVVLYAEGNMRYKIVCCDRYNCLFKKDIYKMDKDKLYRMIE